MRVYFFLVGVFLFSLCSCQKDFLWRIDETVYVRHEGADMPAYVHGSTQSDVFLVVLHGAGSFGLSFRDGGFTSALEEEYVVVYFDQRGQSMSQGHYAKPEDVVQAMADDVEALISVLKHKYGADKSYFLLGHSFGGAVGKLALLENDLQAEVKGWISVCGAHDFPQVAQARKDLLLATADEQVAAGKSLSEWKELKNQVVELDPMEKEDYSTILQQAVTAMDLLQRDEVVPAVGSSEKLKNALLTNNPITWQVSHFFNQPVNEALENDFSLTSRLSEIILPTLLLYGRYDMSVPPAIGQSAFNGLGSTAKRFVIFETSMHHPHDTEADLFTEEVVQFIEEHK
jgi:pimeloyl-ACP methyl ester carboxylesterase